MSSLLPALVRRLPLLLAVLLLAVLVLNVPAFRRSSYWLALPREQFAIAALALALVPIVIAGGIDLSVGSIAILSSLVIEYSYREWGVPVPASFGCGLMAGLIAGLVNGLIVRVGVMPLVATLATRELFRGVAWLLATEVENATRLPASLRQVWMQPQLGLPLALWGILALALVSYLLIHHTWIGRSLFAMGDNERAARFAAIPVSKITVGIYTWAGLIGGLCGVGLAMKYPAAKVDAEHALELLAIACVVMGGVRVTGGAGHVGGVLLGIVTVIALLAGLQRAPAGWRETWMGIVLILMALVGEAGARWLMRRSVASRVA